MDNNFLTAELNHHHHHHRRHEEVSCADKIQVNSSINANDSHQADRYNHYPCRSSLCYSSSNLVSHSSEQQQQQQQQQWEGMEKSKVLLPCSTSIPIIMTQSSSSTTCMTSSDSSSDDVSSSQSPSAHDDHGERKYSAVDSLSRDEFSIQSVLSLYQAFAKYSASTNANNHTVETDQWVANVSIDEDDERTPRNHLGNAQIGQGENCIPNGVHDGQSWSSIEEISSNKITPQTGEMNNGRNAAISDGPNDDDDDDDNKSITSLTSYSSSTPTNSQLSYTNFLHRHRKKIASLLLSLMTVGIYAHHHRKVAQFRKRYYLLNGNHSNLFNLGRGKILSVCRWLLRLLSPFTVSNNLHNNVKSNKVISPPSSSSSEIMHPIIISPTSVPSCWKNVPTTPLSHLLAMSKSRDIHKVILRGPVLSYLHTIQSSSPSLPTSSPSAQRLRSSKQLRWSQTTLPSRNSNILNEIITNLLNHGCDDITTLPESFLQRILNGPAVMALPFAYLAALYWMMRRLQRQQLEDDDNDRGEGSSSWKKGGRHHPNTTTTTFEDVAGIDSSLQELSEVISYMRNPEMFHAVGAQPPRGILLFGPPGSGKTLLARAIAGEAERCVDGIHHLGGNTIDCFAVCSGSEFVETYVGRGAARVRSLFQNVREDAIRNFKRRQKRQNMKWNKLDGSFKKITTGNETSVVTRIMRELGDRMVGIWEGGQSLSFSSGKRNTSNMGSNQHQQPMAIIFIDELDCLAKRRDSGFGLPSSLGGGGCDEREQTLNQLLTEMDGFDTGDSTTSSTRVHIIVIAATNRPEVLDPAIMRPGRFDRHVRVNLPDARGREAILRVHARRIRWDRSSVDFAALPTHNFSGADLKNVINEAALFAVRSGSSAVTQTHLIAAVHKVRDQLQHC